MTSLPYFKFYASDWLADVLDLPLDQRGAYITFLAWSWKRGPLPYTRAARAQILGVSPRRLDTIWPALSAHWVKNGSGFVNPRLEIERLKASERSEKARASAEQRHGKS